MNSIYQIRVGQKFRVQILHQVSITFEEKINGELFQDVRNVFVRWSMVNKTFHIDTKHRK